MYGFMTFLRFAQDRTALGVNRLRDLDTLLTCLPKCHYLGKEEVVKVSCTNLV